MTALHQRRWQLRMKWWQITHPCVLANGKKKKILLLFIIFCFMYLYPISSPPLHFNYYFPLSVPGHRARWAFPSPLQGQGSFPEHTGGRRVTARMRWTRIDFSTSQSSNSIKVQIHYPLFLWPVWQTPPSFSLCSLSLSLSLSICTQRYSDTCFNKTRVRVLCIKPQDIIFRIFCITMILEWKMEQAWC